MQIIPMYVTFVMPAYNAADYIGEAIVSLQSQTVKDWRLVVVDDASTDSTAKIVERLTKEDNRIGLIRMEKGSGSAYQPRKRAILEADTEWVAPLDADDFVEADYLEKLLAKQLTTNADAVYPVMWQKREEDDFRVTPSESFVKENSIRKGNECVELTLDGWRINCNGGLIRKKYYLKTFDKYGSDLTYSCADELLTRQLLFSLPKVAFSEARYFYRVNPESITRKKSIKLIDFLINNVSLLDFTKANFGEDSSANKLAQRQNFHGIFQAVRLLNKFEFSESDSREAMRRVRESLSKVDFKALKGQVSPRYLSLLRSGLGPTRFFIGIYDRLGSKKK